MDPAGTSADADGGHMGVLDSALGGFTCKAESVKLLFNLVSAVYSMKKDQFAVVGVNRKGEY
jgi:hypothetical protein